MGGSSSGGSNSQTTFHDDDLDGTWASADTWRLFEGWSLMPGSKPLETVRVMRVVYFYSPFIYVYCHFYILLWSVAAHPPTT